MSVGGRGQAAIRICCSEDVSPVSNTAMSQLVGPGQNNPQALAFLDLLPQPYLSHGCNRPLLLGTWGLVSFGPSLLLCRPVSIFLTQGDRLLSDILQYPSFCTFLTVSLLC